MFFILPSVRRFFQLQPNFSKRSQAAESSSTETPDSVSYEVKRGIRCTVVAYICVQILEVRHFHCDT